jgi:D-sedoheptulose 7-phosphate isomerase
MQEIRNIIQQSIDVKTSILSDQILLNKIDDCVEKITTMYKNKNRLYLCGNGGSAADAQHIAAEFTGRFYKNRIALPAEALHVNTSYVTAVANDYGFDEVYSRLIEGIGNEGDILIAISTSGNSKNIINAINKAKENKLYVIGFTGEDGGEMKNVVDCLINIPSMITPRIQESHILVGHIICELVEKKYFNA